MAETGCCSEWQHAALRPVILPALEVSQHARPTAGAPEFNNTFFCDAWTGSCYSTSNATALFAAANVTCKARGGSLVMYSSLREVGSRAQKGHAWQEGQQLPIISTEGDCDRAVSGLTGCSSTGMIASQLLALSACTGPLVAQC